MITENRELMSQARESLSGKWGSSAAATLVYVVIILGVAIIPIAGAIANLFIAGPLLLGFVLFFMAINEGEEPKISMIFDGFKNFGTAFGTYILMVIFIFLWSLLLIIPGIIAAFAYSMAFYIIAEDDAIGPMEALKKSKQMMQGHKMKLFLLSLRFIGWYLLAILTLGIGLLWLAPYVQVSFIKFYEDIKQEQ